jgi:NAD(P)-dependent dehydrogenase (short-subunit alcohol dehydrogenase family)
VSTASTLAGKTVLVTGGARGIGRALCEVFGQAGAQIALCDIDSQAAQATAAALSDQQIQVHTWELDVRDRSAWDTVVLEIEATLGPVDILIGNAGIMAVGDALSLRPQTESRQVDINLMGVIHGVHAVLPGMLQRQSGHIVHMASLAGRIPTPFGASYAATKFGVVGLTEALRHELHGSGISLTCVMPGFVQTELVSGLATPSWPRPRTPTEVAQSTLKGVMKLVVLPWVVPHTLSIWLSRLFGVHAILKPVDEDARLPYRTRAAITSIEKPPKD